MRRALLTLALLSSAGCGPAEELAEPTYEVRLRDLERRVEELNQSLGRRSGWTCLLPEVDAGIEEAQ